MKLVKFKDGKYGVRRGFWPFYQFKDFIPIYGIDWRFKFSHCFKDCRTTKEKAEEYYYLKTCNGKPVKVDK